MIVRRPFLTGAVIPLTAVLGASVCRWGLGVWLGRESPLQLYIVAVVVGAWFGGWPGGAMATVLSVVAGTVLFIIPYTGVALPAPELTRIAVFIGAGMFVTWAIAQLQTARTVADETAADLTIAERLRKLSNEAADTARSRLELLADALPVLISYVDTEQRYRYNNRAYEQWFGQPRGMIHGQHIRDVVGPRAYEAIRPHIESVLGGAGVEFETAIPYQQAGTRNVRVMYVPDRADDGSVRGFFAMIMEIDRKLT